jgi:hypothetical protein
MVIGIHQTASNNRFQGLNSLVLPKMSAIEKRCGQRPHYPEIKTHIMSIASKLLSMPPLPIKITPDLTNSMLLTGERLGWATHQRRGAKVVGTPGRVCGGWWPRQTRRPAAGGRACFCYSESRRLVIRDRQRPGSPLL